MVFPLIFLKIVVRPDTTLRIVVRPKTPCFSVVSKKLFPAPASNIAASKFQTLILRQIPDAAPRELSAQINVLAQRIQDTSPQDREKFRQSLQVILTELKPVFEALNTEKAKTDSLKKP